MDDNKKSTTIWLRPSVISRMDGWLEADNCQSRSEFVDKALRFYMGYLGTEDNTTYISQAILTAIQGTLDDNNAYAEFFMKRMERGEQEPPSVLLSATRLLYHMGNIFRDNAPAPAANGIQIDRKRLAQMRQKRVALGHKPDDHELEQQQGFSMKFHM